jgi:esterase/lipase superfamily enzyme
MTHYSMLQEAIALLWSDLPAHFGDRWPEVDLRLTTLLRALDGDEPEAAEDQLYDLFALSPDALTALNLTVGRLTKGQDRATTKAPAAPGVRRHERYVVVPVLFGTDRRVVHDGGGVTYTGERGLGLTFGCASVSIPDDHRMGAVERPRWWRLEFREDPAHHVVITAVEELDRARFVERGRTAAEACTAREALVFVHGYNVEFDDAMRRAAQVAYDLHFGGVAMLFSWPSCGTLQGYLTDETNIRWAQNDFREFLRLCLSQLGLTSVHVLAHSMGNRVLAETLGDATPVREDDTWARLDQIVFAAPDIDTDTFSQLAALFHGRASRVTLYASPKDLALEQSRRFHGYPRAGDCADGAFLATGVDAIDASAVDSSLMGHSYYGDNRSLLGDLFQLIRRRGPEQRFGLIPRQGPSGRYWEFRPGGS